MTLRTGRVEPFRRGEVLRVPRGRVLTPLRQPAPTRSLAPRISPDLWRALVFVAILPLFAETFAYVVDIDPIYRLAKGWPLITLPLAGWGLVKLDLPYKAPLLLVIGWTLGVTPLIGILELGNLIGGALASTLKVWALAYGFSAAAALAILRPKPEHLKAIVLGLGAVTFVSFVIISAVAPQEAYFRTVAQTKIFFYDLDRGNRVNVPMFFGLLSMFTVARSFWRRPTVWQPAILALCFYVMITIYKERTPITGAALIIALGGVLSTTRWRIPILVGLVAVAAIAIPSVLLLHVDSVAKGLGGSLTVRQEELGKAMDFLNAQPWRWITGVGSATRIGDITLADIVGARVMYLADLGWMGVTFEYGAIGVALLVVLHAAGLKLTWQAVRHDDPLSGALFDYVLYIVLSSAIYSVVLSPGELLTCMALAWYMIAYRRAEAATA